MGAVPFPYHHYTTGFSDLSIDERTDKANPIIDYIFKKMKKAIDKYESLVYNNKAECDDKAALSLLRSCVQIRSSTQEAEEAPLLRV